MKEFEELVQDCELFEENVHDAERILKLKKVPQRYFDELGTSSVDVVRKELKSIIDDNKAQITSSAARMEAIAATHGFKVEDYYVAKGLQEATENEDSVWKKKADKYLESVRPCKRIRGNVTTIVPVGASGFNGSVNHDTDGDIDVLDESAKPDIGDTSYNKLNVFTESDDNNDKEKPCKVIQPRTIKVSSFIVPADFAILMKPHQSSAVVQILTSVAVQKSGFLLAHSMGLGKTLTTIAALQAMSTAVPNLRIAVICPKSLLNHWYTEMEKWDDYITFFFYQPIETDDALQLRRWTKRGGVIIISHNRFTKMTLEDGFGSDMLVVDEAHLMKNPSTQLYEAMTRHTEPKLLLTGSPLQNHLTEYFSMIKLIKPDLITDADFRKDFAKVIDRGAFAGATSKELKAARTQIAVLTRLTEPYVHRRSAAALKESLKPMKEYKLSYIAPYSKDIKSPLERSNETITQSLNVKVKLGCILLDSIAKSKDKVLVFSRRKDVLTTLQKQRAGLFMDGDTLSKTRHELVELFQTSPYADRRDTNIFYMTTKVGGVGLNLHAANRIIILDPSWNPVDDKQACFRVFRYGQTKTVRVYRFIVAHSIEERIYRLAVHKNLAACRIIDDKEVNRHFTEDQLMVLDKFEHETLDTTGDKALDRVIHNFTVSSHDVLFADSESEKLSDEEKNDADNEFNRIQYLSPRYFEGSDNLYGKHDITFDDGSLISPLPPVFTSYALPGSNLSTWQPLMPYSPSLTHYTLEIKGVEGVDYQDTMMVDASFTQTDNWAVKLQCSGSFRMRCKSGIKSMESEWSEWSAIVTV